MGFLQNLFKQKSKQTQVIIPEHVKEREQQAEDKVRISVKQGLGKFKVNGIFAPKGTTLILGKVLSGQLRPGMKTSVNEKEIIITEVSLAYKKVEQLLSNQEGSILLDKFSARIEIGDILEFKQQEK
ncbi:MAG: hypothetical protein Q7S92_05155 [Candidatus Diapherotrites archaeon]|nr:hypothetical protein [Candidatus Diapherotrites archaeon]